MAVAANFNWNAEMTGTLEFPNTANVAIKFVSSVNPPRYQSKTILWTLVEVFDFYAEQRQYSNAYLITHLGEGPNKQNLGVASIRSTISSDADLPDDSAVSHSQNDIYSKRQFPVRETYSTSDLMLASGRDLSLFPSESPNSTAVAANIPGLALTIVYIQNGATISDRGLYNLIINTLIFAGQHDPKDLPCGLVSAYNSLENYTLAMGPTSEAAQEKLPWKFASAALSYLPSAILEYRRGGRWAELSGRIKLDGAYIGKIQIVKGDHRPPPQGSCDMALRADIS